MRKRCLACGKEWMEGKTDDGLISHGICRGYCTNILELWTFNDKGMTLKEFYQDKQKKKEG